MAIDFTLSPGVEDVRLRVRAFMDEGCAPPRRSYATTRLTATPAWRPSPASGGARMASASGIAHVEGGGRHVLESGRDGVRLGRGAALFPVRCCPYKEAGGVSSAGLFTSWCCVGYAVRTSRIGRCDSWSTSSATLPNMTRLMPRRECVAITIASASASFAVATITFAA